MKAQLQPKFGRKTKGGVPEAPPATPDEPIAAIADSGPKAPLVSELPPPPPIALDLAPALPNDGQRYEKIIIKVEGMAQGASLTAGRNNGDRTCSLEPGEIDGVCYVLAHGVIPHTLHVRVIGFNEDHATTLTLLETDIGTDGAATPLRLFSEAFAARSAEAADNGDDLETASGLTKALNQSREKAQTRIAAAKAASEADEADQLSAVAPEELIALQNRMQELESQLAEKEATFEAAETAWETERRSLAGDAQARIDDARDAAVRTTQETVAKSASQRETEAVKSWEREKELLLAEAKVQLEEAIENSKPEKVRAKAEAAFEKEKKKLLADADKRIAVAEKAARALAEAKAKGELTTAATAAQASVDKIRLAAAQELSAAQQNWESEKTALQADLDDQLKRAAEAAQKSAEDVAARAVAEARSAWETESESRTSAALKQALADADAAAAASLAEARAGWDTERTALEDSAEAKIKSAVDGVKAAAEDFLAKTVAEAKQGQKAEMQALVAETDQRIRDEATSKVALEAELAKARAAIDIEVNRARATWDIEMAALRAEMAAKVDAARAEGVSTGRTAATEALANDENGALAEARAEWSRELDETVARVRAEAEQAAKSAQASTLGVAVEAARAEWNAERQQLEDEAGRRIEEAHTKSAAAQVALDEARISWEAEKSALLADADARIAAAGAGDAGAASAEAARRDATVQAALADAEKRWQRELDIQADTAEKRIAAMRVSNETELDVELQKGVKAALAEARTKWEKEIEGRLSEAREAWQSGAKENRATKDLPVDDELAKRLAAVEAQLKAPTGATAQAGKAKTGKPDPKLTSAIAKWNKTHKRRRSIPLPRISRRMAFAAIAMALIAGGVTYYQNGVTLYKKYAPVVDAEVVPRAKLVTKQAKEIAATVGDVIRDSFPDSPPVVEGSDALPVDDDALSAFLRNAWVKPDAANLRATPSTSGALVTTLSRGAEVEQLGARGLWIHVRANGREGWMHASLLSSRAPR